MTIRYPDFEAFHAGLYELVKLGVTFTADAGKLTIELTGGF